MEKTEILKKINKIFIDVLDDENVLLNETSTAGDINGWDSLTHIQLVVSIEKHFKIRFTSKEIQCWQNVGEMCNSIIQKN